VTHRGRGIPAAVRDLSHTFDYNNIDSLEASLDDDTAAVIMEPTVFEAPAPAFLRRVAEVCRTRGVLLIFDEMWTGFRMALGGAQEYYGVVPDLAVFSKAVSNGMPLSVVTGRRGIMSLLEKDVFFFTTFGGEALSLAAAAATIDELEDKSVPAYLHEQGARLRDGYNRIAASLGLGYTRCIGYGYRSLVVFDASAGDPLLLKSYVQQELIRRGLLWSGFHTMSFSHGEEEIEFTLQAYQRVLPLLGRAVELGTVKAEPVFRRTSQFNSKPVGR